MCSGGSLGRVVAGQGAWLVGDIEGHCLTCVVRSVGGTPGGEQDGMVVEICEKVRGETLWQNVELDSVLSWALRTRATEVRE